jgi:hypothetical protein
MTFSLKADDFCTAHFSVRPSLISPIFPFNMSEETKTTAEEPPKEEEKAGETEEKVKEEESTATFEPVVRST